MAKPKSSEPIVWIIERELIFENRHVPTVLPPSATREDAESKLLTLPTPQMYRVVEYQRIGQPRKPRKGRK